MADESALRKRSKVMRQSFTDAIKTTAPPDSKIYGAATNWVYQACFGSSAAKLRKQYGVSRTASLRDQLTDVELVTVMFTEVMAAEQISVTGTVDRRAIMLIGTATAALRKNCLQ